MFSKQLESAIAAEVAAQRIDLLKHIKLAVIGEVNRIFDQALNGTPAKLAIPAVKERGVGKPLKSEVHAYIRKQFDAEVPMREIARIVGVNLSTVQRSLKKTKSKGAVNVRHRTNDQEKADILRLKGQGKDNPQIARELGLSVSTVWRVLNPATGSRAKQKRTEVTPELRERVISLLQSPDKTQSEIADEIGCSTATILRIKNAWVAEEMEKKRLAEAESLTAGATVP